MSAITDEEIREGIDLPADEDDTDPPVAIPEEDAEPEPETEQPNPPEQPDVPLSEKQIEQLQKQLDKEAKRHTSAVERIMGDDFAALIVCELCDANTPGFHWPAAIYPEGDPRRTVMATLSGDDGEEMRHPAYLTTCDECNGFGSVLTGARTELTFTIPCPICKLSGYIDEREGRPVVQLVTQADGTTVEQPAPAAPAAQTDFYGRPPGHPNYGMMPNFQTRAQWDSDKAAGYTVGDEFLGIAG